MLKILLLMVVMFKMGCSQIDINIELIKDLAATFQNKPFFIITSFEKTETIKIITDLSRFGYQSASCTINMASFPSFEPAQNGVIVLTLESESATDILQMANLHNLFASPLKWLIINTDPDRSASSIAEDYFSDLDMLVDSEVILVTQADEIKYWLVKLYKRHKDGELVIENYGTWGPEQRLQRSPGSVMSTAVKRKNLHNTVLRTAIVVTHNDTMNHLTDYRDKHLDSITKVNYILVNHLANIVNASLNYTIKNTWGYKKNNTWTGMIGELTQDRADIGGTPLFVTSDRIDTIDYIAMTTATKSNFVFRQPKLSYVTNVFLLPFHWTVWLSTVALVVVTTFGLYLMLKWEKFQENDVGHLELEPKDSILLSFGAVCQQGAAVVPDRPSGRIVTLFIFVSLMFLFTSYAANIVALLQSSSNSIKTLEDLLKSRLSIGVDDTVFNRFYFPEATEPVRRALYLQKVAPPNQQPRFYPIEEGVRRVRKGLFAFHMEGGPGYKIVGETFFEHEKCDLQEISFLQVPDPWLAIQKNSSYKEMLKIGLRQIQESGLQEREVSRIYTKKPQCHGTGSSFVSVSLIDVYSAVVVFVAGFISSLIIFIIEVFIYKKLFKHKQLSQ